MPSSVINSYTVPDATGRPVVHEDLDLLVEQMSQGDTMRFASETARTVAYTAIGTSPPIGARCYLANRRWFEWYDGTNWGPEAGTLIKRGERATNSSGSTGTELGVLRVDGINGVAGRALWIHTPTLLVTCNAGEVVGLRLRIDTTGAAAGTGSTELRYAQTTIRTGTPDEPILIAEHYTPPSNQTLSVLLTVQRITAGGTAVIVGASTRKIRLHVVAGGYDPGDTGVLI